MSTTEKSLQQLRAEQFRAIADFVESLPDDLAEHLRYTANTVNVPVMHNEDPVAIMAAFARAGLAHGVQVRKEFSEDYGTVILDFGVMHFDVYADRAQVCERVVTGTETVTRAVPDPAAPLVEVTEEVETVEWVCRPLLAAESSSDGAT